MMAQWQLQNGTTVYQACWHLISIYTVFNTRGYQTLEPSGVTGIATWGDTFIEVRVQAVRLKLLPPSRPAVRLMLAL